MNKRKRKKAGRAPARDMRDMTQEHEDVSKMQSRQTTAESGSCGCGCERPDTGKADTTDADDECKCGKPEDTAAAGQTQSREVKTDNAGCGCGTVQEEAAADAAETGGDADCSDEAKTGSDDEQAAAMKADYEAQIAKLTDQLKRSMAEFENYRRRTEQEKLSMFDRGVVSVAEKILPTIDNFERAMASEPRSEDAKAFVSGMELVYKSFTKTLEDIGIKPIECVGREFDPNLHHAVMHEDDDSGETNIITEEFQKGYTLKDKVIRCSMVKVKN